MSTERKFTQPISMECNFDQWHKELKSSFISLGYQIYDAEAGWKDGIIGTNFCGRHSSLAAMTLMSKDEAGRLFIDHYNPELFLALAAMSEGDTFYPGEWVVLHGSLYLCNGMKEGSLLLDMHKGYNFPPNNYRKATAEEIINHFTKKGEVKDPEAPAWKPVFGEKVQGRLKNGKYVMGTYIERSDIGSWHYVQEMETTYQCASVEAEPKVVVHLSDLLDEYARKHSLSVSQINLKQ